MTALMRSELLKVRTVRTFLWVMLANAALVFAAALSVTLSSNSITSASDDRSAAQIAAVSLLMALIGGIIIFGGEATHGTITQTLLVTPVRERVFLAKIVVGVCFGFALAVIAEIITLVVVSELHVHNARLVLLGTLIGAPLTGALGVGLGAIFHGQGVAITVSLIWLLIGEGIAAFLRDDLEKYTPGRAFGSLVSGVTSQEGLLGMTGGGFVAAAWTVAFLAAGILAFVGRDV